MKKIDEYKQLWHNECIRRGESLWKECKVDEGIRIAILLKETSTFVSVPTKKQTVFEYYCNCQGMVCKCIGGSSGDASVFIYSLSGWEGGLL